MTGTRTEPLTAVSNSRSQPSRVPSRSQLRGRYNLLFVTDVLDSSKRRFHLLPNPFAADAVDVYRVRNRGFRFSFRL